MRETGQVIRRARNTIDVLVGPRPPTGDHPDGLTPETGQRVAAPGELCEILAVLKRRGHGALDLLWRPADVGAVMVQHVELPADRGAAVGHVEQIARVAVLG